jgi:(4S)-4-hydroxy-5-phosphonooxypentane-2,3-dione isomerase
MIVTAVHVRVKPERVAEFIEATRLNHEGSVEEPGNVRFDVLQSPEDPTVFLLYEVWQSESAAAAHKATPHYSAWRTAVSDWMAEPRRGVLYNPLFPRDREAW